MAKKLYVCDECGRDIPPELTNLIEKKVQIYCEQCGTPFSLEGVKFKESAYSLISIPPRKRRFLKDKETSSLNNAIQDLNKISFLPIIIVSILAYTFIFKVIVNPADWIGIVFGQLALGTYGLLIGLYDLVYISPKIKEKKYNEVMLDSFCWGILGCIFVGTGVILLIKGILVMVYVIGDPENKDLKNYDIGLLMKNSFNRFSAIAGLVIIILALGGVFTREIILSLSEFIVFLCLSLGALLIDLIRREKYKEKEDFLFSDFLIVLTLGILGVMFAAAGIFVLLKGVLTLFLLAGTPTKKPVAPAIHEKTPEVPPQTVQPRSDIPKQKVEEKPIEKEKIEIKKAKKDPIQQIPASRAPIEKPLSKKEKERELENKERALEIHESLLPVKDDKDRKVVKEYLTKIFAVLSKDMRDEIIDLKIPKKEKKELIQELAFLAKEEQIKYIDGIISLYKEIPKKLISRIRRLPNVKPEHYDKIIDQLKQMDMDEQIRFVEFLEEHA